MSRPRLEFDKALEIVRTIYRGTVTDSDLHEGNAAVMRVVKEYGPCSGITDFTEVTKFNVSGEQMWGLAHLTPAIPAERTKVVVAPKDVPYGMSRIFQTLTEEFRPKLHVVRSMAEAYALLGMTSPQFSPL